jgi:hypothetical protein
LGKSQRTKGATYEREVAQVFSAALGIEVKRNIGQARDGGNDLDVGPLVVECKRRKTLTTIEGWMLQAQAAANERRRGHEEVTIPVVVARADAGKSLVIISLADFLILTRDELAEYVG